MYKIVPRKTILTAGAAMPDIIKRAESVLVGQRIRGVGSSPKAYEECDPESADILALSNGTNVFAQVDDEGNGGGEIVVAKLVNGRLIPTYAGLSAGFDNTITEIGYCQDTDDSEWQSVGPYLKISNGLYLVAVGRKGHAVFYYENQKESGVICTIHVDP
jgi:hypothetical protein